MYIHTTASWPGREDRRAALVWLAIFWIFVGVGFGFDLHNYLREQPPVPKIVHVHAIATTLWLLTATALVLMVETGNVRFHRRFGWFAASSEAGSRQIMGAVTYSVRRACIGSTAAARRAGSRHAVVPTASSRPTAPALSTGSYGLTSKSRLLTTRADSNARNCADCNWQ